jgi:hypothetical protein
LKGNPSMTKTLTLLAAAAVATFLAIPSAEAQRARSMYGTPGADAPATTQSASARRSPLEGTYAGTFTVPSGNTYPISITVSNVNGSTASIQRVMNRTVNNDVGGRISGNTVSFGNRTPMTMTVRGDTATLSGTMEDGRPIRSTLTRR